jgi:hypothetical protein
MRQLSSVEQIEDVAVKVHRCVIEMQQRIGELAKLHAMVLPSHITRQTAVLSEEARNKMSDLSSRLDDLAQLPRAPGGSVPKLNIRTLHPDAGFPGKSPRQNRIRSSHPQVTVSLRAMNLWQNIPQLHACYLAAASSDWALLLTAHRVKKDDVRLTCVSLNHWSAFLRHCKAYIKLGISRNLSKQAFDMALNIKEFTFDEYRVNFFGFCQVKERIPRNDDDNLQKLFDGSSVTIRWFSILHV